MRNLGFDYEGICVLRLVKLFGLFFAHCDYVVQIILKSFITEIK